MRIGNEVILPIRGKRLIKTEMVEVIIPANLQGAPKTKIMLPDIPNLRESHLWQIKTYINRVLPKGPSTKLNVIDINMEKNIFLSLMGYNGKLFQSQKPLLTLNTTMLSAIVVDPLFYSWEGQPVRYTGQKVNWPKSYIELADSSLISIVEDQVVVLQVYYSAMQDVEKKDRKATFKKQT